MKKLLFTTLCILGLSSVAFAAPEITIKAAQSNGAVGAQQEPWIKFKEVVEAKSEGRILVELYPGAVLGSCNELAEKAMLGIIQMGSGSSSNLTTVNPKLEALELPYVVNNMHDQMKLFYKGENGRIGGELFEELNAPMLQKGIRFVGIMPFQYRDMGVNFEDLKSPEQLEGKKIRSTASQIERECISAMGANPVTMAFGEVYTALQQGTIDGEGLPVDLMYDMKHHEVVESIARIRYNTFFSTMYVNEQWYQSLPEWARVIVDDALFEAIQHGNKVFKQLEDERIKDLTEAGVEIYTPNTEQFKVWEALLMPVREKNTEKVGKEWLEKLQAALK